MVDGELIALVEGTRRGERPAAEALAARYHRRVVRFCLSFPAIREADAMDLAQDTLVRALRGLGGLREPARFEGWLFAIARGRCLTHLGQLGRQRRALEAFAQELATREDPVGAARQREAEQAVVAEELARLEDSGPKQAGRLYYLDGLDTAEIAARLGVPQGTVSTWLFRLRARLRARLIQRVLALRTGEASP
ncbi:MAG TPA: sigma-70 family RNA polymerase sigma factor [Myxococcota bacterium]|nr:sigma-70 family RNA polymerase sigma factor [Myxococcota bacterium]HRY91848.1 sigma-70 family RNA polymerase sigma factor [Myxococcota bacterium]HSA20565.1 sigma-70 family RNA polymerase sigma factor [Myxococcota bacterium]